MSRKENIIFELHTKKGTWKIVVRINDMWHVNKHNGRKAIEMVFMDQMGAKIGATFSRELFVEFESRLHCGSAYVIQNIKVVENHSEYKVSNIPFLVYEAEHPEILPSVYVITSFTDIIVEGAPRDTLVDIIGVLVEVIKCKTINPTYKVTVKLRDNSQYSQQSSGGKFLHNAKMVSLGQITNLTQDCYCLIVGTVNGSGDEVKVFPPCVDELLRKTWALRFKYSVQIRQSFVLDVTEDEDIIHTIRSTISLQVVEMLSFPIHLIMIVL
ncbi:hypothetical protein glysoja_023684 [Glycine soja]|nr:hypothetical protein glysoja_023684 [Glycine soja]